MGDSSVEAEIELLLWWNGWYSFVDTETCLKIEDIIFVSKFKKLLGYSLNKLLSINQKHFDKSTQKIEDTIFVSKLVNY